jgi:DNA-binding winged helix-turn-helix (wHTH) protein
MMRLAFGEFVLDTGARELTRAGARVHLEPKALELLDLLVARRPEAIAKGEIQQRLWPDTFVSESSLTGLVAQVRSALADDRRQERFLRTVHGFGYAFCGAVRPETAERAMDADAVAVARLLWEDATFVLAAGEHVLGRSADASVRIDAPGVSRRHARLVVTREEATVEDLASKNGTFVREQRLVAPHLLRDGDTLRLGRQLLVFRRGGASAPTVTESPPPGRGGV